MSDYAALLGVPMTVVQRQAIAALVEHGSQGAAADALGWKRSRVQSCLRKVQRRAAPAAIEALEAPVVRGAVEAMRPQIPDEARARTSVYIVTSQQNNTPIHPAFWTNLLAYREARGARLMVSRFSYNKGAYRSAKSTKAGRHDVGDSNLWYDEATAPYICDDPERHGSCRWQLAPDLMWCAESNQLPTATLPLSGKESLAGAASGIFPHAKIAMFPVAVIGERAPKFNYSTGTCTLRNYIQKDVGIKAEFHHTYGALVVEVDNLTGHWWVRQLNATDDGSFNDLTFRVHEGRVTRGHRLLAINWGDIHASEIDPTVARLNWGLAHGHAAIDILQPRTQLWHDTMSFRNRSHHEMKDVGARYAKWVGGALTDSVDSELATTAALFKLAHREWCETVVVSSNHDRHGERWLNDADPKQDLVNAELFHEASLRRFQAIREGRTWDFFEWGMQRHGVAHLARFLQRDESFLIGPAGHEIQCGQHGDEGANGSRGNPAAYARMPVRMNVGHVHYACLIHGVASAGVCNRRLPYAHGPSSWSVTHTATYDSGKRAQLTMRDGKLWL